MKLAPRFITHTLCVIAVFITFESPTIAEENDPAFTGFDSQVNVYFPPNKMELKFRKPSLSEITVLEEHKALMVVLLKASGTPLFRALGHTTGLDNVEQVRLFELLERAPVWVCGERCPCPNTHVGCAEVKKFSDSLVGIGYLRECAFSKNGCMVTGDAGRPVRAKSPLLRGTREIFSELMAARLLDTENLTQRRKGGAKVGELIRSTANIYTDMVESCPGPYSKTGLKLLEVTGTLTALGEFQNRCVAQMLEPFRVKKIPPACQSWVDPKLWEERLQKGLLATPVEARRCTDLCELATCAREKERQARPLRFGSQWIVDLPPQRCEGAEPLAREGFVLEVLKWVGRKELSGRPGLAEMAKLCANALLAEKSEVPRGP